jgi:signal peptidase II
MMRWIAVSGLVVVLDQVTKMAALSQLVPYEPMMVVPSFNLTLMYNTGAAFSFLAGAGGWQRWFFVGLALVISVGLCVWLYRLLPGQRRLGFGLSFILGGAVGNLIDRVLYGHVVDFLDVYYQQWHWPAFNIADSAITIGAVLMVMDSLFGRTDQRDPTDEHTRDPV